MSTKLRVSIIFFVLFVPQLFFKNLIAAEILAPVEAETHLTEAIHDPEYMLHHWLTLPTNAAEEKYYPNKIKHLSLREAILLALRYNPNIQNAELDRIIQRYQLRLAQNEFELQFALAGVASVQQSNYSGVGSTTSTSNLASPEMSLRTRLGTSIALKLDNTISPNNNYLPSLNFSINQPLLRGFGKGVNQIGLLNAEDNEWLNKINLKQSVMDQITEVILTYRTLIVSSNTYQNQKYQLKEAEDSFAINEKKIAAGQLEPTANIQGSYQIESLKLMVEQANNDFQTASQNLLQMIGLNPEMRLAVPDDIEVGTIQVPDLQASIDRALRSNSQYLAQKMLLRADERAFKQAKNQQLWSLDLSTNVQSGQMNEVTGGRGFRNIYNGNNTSEYAALKLSIPFRDINRRSQLINAKVRLEKDRLQCIAMRRALITSITNSITTIKSQAKRYQLAIRQVALAKKSYELEKKKQQAGISSGLDVNNTQNQLLQAEAGLIAAKISYLNEISSMQRLLGSTLEAWQIQLRYGSNE